MGFFDLLMIVALSYLSICLFIALFSHSIILQFLLNQIFHVVDYNSVFVNTKLN